MNCSEGSCSSCISDLLKKILILQAKDYECNSYAGCDKPFLGPIATQVCYNTRPIQLYNCCNGSPWTFEYTLPDGSSGSSNVFRIESMDDCCCTCRLLTLDPTTSQYVNTGQFVTIDLNCCGALRCLTDTFIDLCS